MPFISGSGGGGGVVSNASAVGDNSGNATTTSASFVDVGKGLSLTIAAAVGDKLLFTTQGRYQVSVAFAANFKLVTTTGANIMDAANLQTVTPNDVRDFSLGGIYTVVSGDISGGNVAIKLQYAADGANTLTLLNASTNLVRIAVANLLH